jgi:2-dehydropantoate 2-reductase
MARTGTIAIVGAGPVGGILGAYLTCAGREVVLCDVLKNHLDAIQRDGLTLTGVKEMTVQGAKVAYSIGELGDFPELNTIVIATKATIMPRLMPELKRVALPGTRFISCQNGLGNEEFLADNFGADNALRIVVNYAGVQTGDGTIWMSFFNPPNYIGALTAKGEPLARSLAEILSAAGLTTRFTRDVKKHVWEKVILNSALNPLCALTQKMMKDMVDCPETWSMAEELVREGIAVAEASGVTFDEGFFDFCTQYLHKTGYHRTSMQQDVLRKVPTEIDWLSGKIVEQGRSYGVKTPYNLAVTALIKGLEVKSRAPEEL